jgi:hypothetical protein
MLLLGKSTNRIMCTLPLCTNLQKEELCGLLTGRKRLQAMYDVTLRRAGRRNEGAGYINVSGGCADREGQRGRLHAVLK